MNLEQGKNAIGRDVVARDGRVGRVKDMVLDSVVWTVQVVVTATGRWINVLDRAVPRQRIERVEPNRLVVDVVESQLAPFSEARNVGGAEGNSEDFRYLRGMIGEALVTRSGEFGRVKDVVINMSNWHVIGVVVDTRRRLRARRILLPIQWVETREQDTRLYTPVERGVLRNAPRFNSKKAFDADHLERITRYYARSAESR